MPTINIAFKEKGISAIKRSERGIVALILKEADLKKFASTTITVYDATDIPVGLTAANKEQIQFALVGYVTSPKRVIVILQDAADANYNKSLAILENTRFDYLVIPSIAESEETVIATWIKAQRANDKDVKAVLPSCKADTEGVINFTNTVIKTAAKEYTTADYCSRIAGIIAGTPMTISCTYAPLTEVVSVDTYNKTECDSKVDSGELFIFFDGEKCKIARGVNSLVTTTDGKGEEFKKIKLVDLMDMIHDDIRKTAQDNYLGKYANSYDNRCLLVAAIQGYFSGLENDGLLEKGTSVVEIDIEATKTWLLSNGLYSKEQLAAMKDIDIKKANIHDNVFISCDIKMLDAIESINIRINI